jgi:hypothetical protein
VCVRVSSYSEVGAIEKRDMVNSVGGGTKDRNLGIGVGCALIVPVICPITFKHLAPVIYSAGAPGDVVASGSSLVLPRAAAGTRGQHSTLHYSGASAVRYAMQGQQRGAQERRREGGTRERGKGPGSDVRCPIRKAVPCLLSEAFLGWVVTYPTTLNRRCGRLVGWAALDFTFDLRD